VKQAPVLLSLSLRSEGCATNPAMRGVMTVNVRAFGARARCLGDRWRGRRRSSATTGGSHDRRETHLAVRAAEGVGERALGTGDDGLGGG
jgi:hypothetical protein